MLGRAIRILKEGKDQYKFGRVIKALGDGNFRVETEDGYRTCLHITEMEKLV